MVYAKGKEVRSGLEGVVSSSSNDDRRRFNSLSSVYLFSLFSSSRPPVVLSVPEPRAAKTQVYTKEVEQMNALNRRYRNRWGKGKEAQQNEDTKEGSLTGDNEEKGKSAALPKEKIGDSSGVRCLSY
ncbi:unnamed protein product [Lactuca saligna]|uniref:Uncharacterized protein n=1 Tax=Lactuca saligna TaxID=75948 RepID=A0AA35ZU76_LACSI|nr:unnamed protein product [Lactuca saligna]